MESEIEQQKGFRLKENRDEACELCADANDFLNDVSGEYLKDWGGEEIVNKDIAKQLEVV